MASSFIDELSELQPSDLRGSSDETSTKHVSPCQSSNFIFGYGSIINNTSRNATLSRPPDSPDYSSPFHGTVIAELSSKFGFRRSWCYRCSTGFTALGLEPVSMSDLAYHSGNGLCGVLFPVPNEQALEAFDLRETGYYRKAIPHELIKILPHIGPPENLSHAEALQATLSSKNIWIYVPEPGRTAPPDEDFPILQTYVDVCVLGCLDWGGASFARDFLLSTFGWNEFYLNDAPLSRRPWLHRPQYALIDRCLEEVSAHVCFEERRHPEEFASQHLTTLQGMWNVPSRNPNFVGRESQLENIQQQLCGAQSEDGRSLSNAHRLVQVQLMGIGGVGKTQLSIEYCHRHFGTVYGLVAFIRAETPGLIAAELRRFALDMGIVKLQSRQRTGTNELEEGLEDAAASEPRELDDEAVVELIKRKLSRCRCRWLFVFDNAEDPSIVEAYLPRFRQAPAVAQRLALTASGKVGVVELSDPSKSEAIISGGHCIITSRVSSDVQANIKVSSTRSHRKVLLDCFQPKESLRYLEVALAISADSASGGLAHYSGRHPSEAHREGSVSPSKHAPSPVATDERRDLETLAERMGHLPLALAQSSAYIVRCDVCVSDYLQRLESLIVSTQVEGDFSIVSSLSISLERILRESFAAGQVLHLLGFLSPDGISKKLVSLLLEAIHFRCRGPLREWLAAASPKKRRVCVVVPDNLNLNLSSEVDSGVDTDRHPLQVNISDNNIGMKWHEVKSCTSAVAATSLTAAIIAVAMSGTLSCRYTCVRIKALSLMGLMLCSMTAGLSMTYVLRGSGGHQRLTDINQSRPTRVSSVTSVDVPATDAEQQEDGEDLSVTNEQVLFEADRVWELMKQFSLLTVRGSRHSRVGSIHRMQQAVLRSRCAVSSASIVTNPSAVDGSTTEAIAIEQCMWAVAEVWDFSASDSATWENCVNVLNHIQTLSEHVLTLHRKGTLRELRHSNIQSFCVLLTEAATCATIVLSRFDLAQTLLETAYILQQQLCEYLGFSVSRPDSLPAHSAVWHTKKMFLDEISNTMHTLGKVLRIRGYFDKAITSLDASLRIRQRVDCSRVADTLHELGVVRLRRHELGLALEQLSKSLDLKRKAADSSAFETTEAATLHQLAIVATAETRYDDAEQLLMEALVLEGGSSIFPAADSSSRPSPSTATTAATTTTTTKTAADSGHGSSSSSIPRSKTISVAATLQQLGRISLRRGALAEAQGRLSRALRLYIEAYGEHKAARHINVAAVRHQLGCCLSASKRYAEASEQFSIALASREMIHGMYFDDEECIAFDDASTTATLEILLEIQSLGQSELERGKLDSAENYFRRQRDMCSRLLLAMQTASDRSRTESDGSVTQRAETYSNMKDKVDGSISASTGPASAVTAVTSSDVSDTAMMELSTTDATAPRAARRRVESTVRMLLFAIHSLKSIANRRDSRDRAKSLSKEAQCIERTYSSLLKKSLATGVRPQHQQYLFSFGEEDLRADDFSSSTPSVLPSKETEAALATIVAARNRVRLEAKAMTGVGSVSQRQSMLSNLHASVRCLLQPIAALLSPSVSVSTTASSDSPLPRLLEISSALVDAVQQLAGGSSTLTLQSINVPAALFSICDDTRAKLLALGLRIED